MKMPIKARASLIRQRILLTIRWCFRLEVDEVKEQLIQRQLDHLLQLNQKQFDTIYSLVSIMNHQQSRLMWYEKNIPRMRELRHEFDLEQMKQGIKGEVDFGKLAKDLENGILPFRSPAPPPPFS